MKTVVTRMKKTKGESELEEKEYNDYQNVIKKRSPKMTKES